MSALALHGGEPIRKDPYPPNDTMIGDEEERLVLDVLRSGKLSGFSASDSNSFLGGPGVRGLEAEFCHHFGVKYAVATNSGSTALQCAVAAVCYEGEEVITTPFTMSATAAAIMINRCTPVFADIEEDTYGISPEQARIHFSARTSAILAVNLFGHPCRLDELKKLADDMRVLLIEDSCQSVGAMAWGHYAGTIGDIGVFSLNCHKTIQCGEGGVAVTNDEKMAHNMRLVRNHGETKSDVLGGNYRMTELCAAVAIAQLKKLANLNAHRIRLAGLLTERLAEFDFLELPVVRDGCDHVYYLYPFKYKADTIGIPRNLFANAMHAEGISVSEGYIVPTHILMYYRNRTGYRRGHFPAAENMWSQSLLTTDICKYPNTEREVDEFALAVRKVVDHASRIKRT